MNRIVEEVKEERDREMRKLRGGELGIGILGMI